MTVDAAKIKASFQEVAANGEQVAYYFYSDLWANYRSSRAFFPEDMKIQRDRFVKAMLHIVANVDRLEQLTPYLKQLGRKHATRYQVQPHHYRWVGESVLATLAYFLGDKWTKDLEEQWTEVYILVSTVMLRGAEEGYGRPDQWGVVPMRTRLHPANRFGRHPGYDRGDVDALALAFEQLVVDNADLLKQLAEADEEIERLREHIIGGNTDLPRPAAFDDGQADTTST